MEKITEVDFLKINKNDKKVLSQFYHVIEQGGYTADLTYDVIEAISNQTEILKNDDGIPLIKLIYE